MDLRRNEDIRREILQTWLKNAWVYPEGGTGEQAFLRLTPGGRLKMRRRIGELEESLGLKGAELARQEEAGNGPTEREPLELAMMVQAYSSERRFIQSQGGTLGSTTVDLDEQRTPEEEPEGTPEA